MSRGPKGEHQPTDVIGDSVHTMRIATGEVEESKPDPATEHMRRGALKGGKARAVVLSKSRRITIAKKAAAARGTAKRLRQYPSRTVRQNPASMPTLTRQRSAPSQARSRAAVARILNATAALIEERGIEAVTTRAIATRADVTIPSLYRFFADREDVLDSLLEHHVATLDARAVAAEQTWRLASIDDLIDRELDLHVAFFEEHSSAARLWFSGRTSPTVAKHVRERMQRLAERMRAALITADLIPTGTDLRPVGLLVELGDRVFEVAFREGATPDRETIELGRAALRAYARQVLALPRP